MTCVVQVILAPTFLLNTIHPPLELGNQQSPQRKILHDGWHPGDKTLRS